MHLVVSPIWPWSTVALVAIGLVVLVLTTYPSRIRHLPRGQRWWLLGLRLAAVASLVIAMLKPAVVKSETNQERAVLIVLGDSSASMQTPDGPGGISRRQALLRTLDDVKKQFEALGDDLEIRYFDFAQDLVPAETLADVADGKETAIGAVLERVIRETQNQRVAGVVMLSDGAQRAMPPLDRDPREVARLLGELQVPVFTVGFGGSGFSENAVEVVVEEILVDPIVFEKKVVTVTARVRIHGALGRKIPVALEVEDRTGRKQGQSGQMKTPAGTANTRPTGTVTAKNNGQIVSIELSYIPDRHGEFKIGVVAEKQDGELPTPNNRRDTIITVRQGGLNVAYFDKLRPEQKFIRLMNRSENIQLDFYPIRSGEFAALTRIDKSVFQPGRYDVYMIGDVPHDVFAPNQLDELAARVREGSGLLMTGGYRSFSPGGYASTPLAELLPVEMRESDRATEEGIRPELHFFKPLPMLPTARGETQHYVMRLDVPSRNRDRWSALPPLQGANRLREKPDALVEVLAASSDGTPLLFAHEVGGARVMAFAADTTYQWVLAGKKDDHQRFWRQMILYLARKELEGDQPVWVRVDPRNFASKQRVPLTFGARDDDGKALGDATFEVEVSHRVIDPKTGKPKNSFSRPAPRRSGNESVAELRDGDTEDAGDYWVRVRAEHGGESLGIDAWTRFIVDARDIETDNPAADHALLKEIAELTGGSAMQPEGLASLLGRMLEEGVGTAEVTQVTRIRLWDNWPFLGLFVGVMSLEWLLRKKRGLV